MKKMLLIPHVFVAMNWAAVVGLVYFLKGEGDVWRRPLSTFHARERNPQSWA